MFDPWTGKRGLVGKPPAPKCHACGEPIIADLCLWHGDTWHEDCLRSELEDELEEAIKEAREDIEWWA